MNGPRMMTLQAACGLLVRIHTRDDDLTGFVILNGAGPEDWERTSYMEAWAVVRQFIEGGNVPVDLGTSVGVRGEAE